jgi:hypothetical protein
MHAQNSKSKISEDKNELTIIIIKESSNQKIDKQKIITQVTEIAKKYGYSSFDIKSKKDVQVILGKKNWPTVFDFHQNLYQEEIVERKYNLERIINDDIPENVLKKALKIQIKGFCNTKGFYKIYK